MCPTGALLRTSAAQQSAGEQGHRDHPDPARLKKNSSRALAKCAFLVGIPEEGRSMAGQPRFSIAVLLLLLGSGALPAPAQTVPAKKTVRSAADLPRFSYPVAGSASQLLGADEATFDAFARKVGADVDAVLASYAITDKATLRDLLGAQMDVRLLMGDARGALATLAELRDLQEKPEARATSGLIARAYLLAFEQTGGARGPAFDRVFAKEFESAVDTLPWEAVQDAVKGMKSETQLLTPALLLGSVQESIDPQTLKTQAVDFTAAKTLLDYRALGKFLIPEQGAITPVLTAYIRAHDKPKPDIWAPREVTLGADAKLTPVRIGIWDSGVDTALYPEQLFTDPHPGAHSPHGLAWDTQGRLYNGDLQPLTPEQRQLYPSVIDLEQGLNDLQNNIDSAAAERARKYMATTPPDKMAPFLAQLDFLGQWMHGTHVAGIAVRGNPAARLVVAQFYDGLPDLPFAPTVEWANRFKADFAELGAYFREQDVRVVNMSWGDSQSEVEAWLAKTSEEKDVSVRKQLAGQIYAIWREAVEGAIRAAPGTLFVCAAGNSDSDAGFVGDVPASLHLANLITVGAVDQAGTETSFTSYGATVVLHADGYQVESYIPGGTRIRFSGTSMASPNVVNLAAKLIALDPGLTPEQTIALMKKGADTSADGRLHRIDPRATVALLQHAGH